MRGRARRARRNAEVAADLLEAARRAAKRIDDGFSLLDDPRMLDAFRLANRAMALAAVRHRVMLRRLNSSSVAPYADRPLALRPTPGGALRSYVRPWPRPWRPDAGLGAGRMTRRRATTATLAGAQGNLPLVPCVWAIVGHW
ncbi:MAG: hypothetical protein HY701_07070 [Gemmatimonadetes bacterium]|nr:hypothetical protein [Gemmatimonadota bacterium]